MLAVTMGALAPRALQAQEVVDFASAGDGVALDAVLTLPETDGPVPAVVLLSIAGTAPLVERLVAEGFAVFAPERRGFVDVEPLLRATYELLAQDVLGALRYLSRHPRIDAGSLAVVAQADDAPPATLAMLGPDGGVPLVMLAPPAFPGDEEFRREQRAAAQRERWPASEIEALDAYLDRIVEIALSGNPPYVREYQLNNVRAVSPVQLPRNAAFPADEDQMHFFASPLWHDRLAFDPAEAIATLDAPTLVLIGSDDADTRTDEYVEAMRGYLAAAPSTEATVRILPGRTRHTFSEAGVDAITGWLRARIGAAPGGGPTEPRPDLNRPGRDPAASC